MTNSEIHDIAYAQGMSVEEAVAFRRGYRHKEKESSEQQQTLLNEYSEFLERYGYTDSDWREEKPTSIERFIREGQTK